MTLIVLGAVIFDRRALTMRNLAFAVLAIVALEPEAILGVSFQLSFAAVGALVAVMEARLAGLRWSRSLRARSRPGRPRALFGSTSSTSRSALLVATLCATRATASFMAYHFHDLSPYVLIGNPLTLTIIEFFAVPGALIGTALYPLGLDAPVWLYVGAGIKFILWVARFIAAAPGSTLHVRAFAPYALPFLSLAVMSATDLANLALRATAIPFSLIGIVGAMHGPRYDVIARPTAIRWRCATPTGGSSSSASVSTLSRRSNGSPPTATGARRPQARDPDAPCDRLGCVGALPEGQSLTLVVDRLAFEEDCTRAESSSAR